MIMTLTTTELSLFLGKQLESFFPDGLTERYYKGKDVDWALNMALERLEYCFKHINRPAYSDESGQTYFSHLHSDQYSQFLYFFMNSLWKKSENKIICDKCIILNKCLNNMFVSYKGELPDIFLFMHPIGTILGNAKYSDYLVVLQNVTVNTGGAGELAPKLGKGLFLASGAQIIGEEPVGDRVSIGVNAVVYKTSIGNDKIVICDKNGKVQIMDSEKCKAYEYFRTPII